MKKTICLFTLLLSSIIILSTGCVTAANPSGQVAVAGVTIDPVATGNAVRIAAKLGAMATIQHDPSTRVYFQLSGNAIAALIASGNYNPTNLQSSLNSVTSNTMVSMSITDALSLYQDFFGRLVSQNLDAKSPYTVPVLSNLALGIQDAVNLTASVTSTSSTPVTVNTIPAP